MTNLHVIPTPKVKLAYSSTPQLSSNGIFEMPIEVTNRLVAFVCSGLFAETGIL